MEAGLGSQATGDQDSGANTPRAPAEGGAGTIPPAAKFPTPSSETLTRQFPQLEILELLGQGGMGVVYKARQRRLNRLVALKILPPSIGEQPAFAERFSREAQALARLNHWNIVQVHDFGETDEFFYFIMEFVDGVNLRTLIRDGKLKPEEALAIVPQICEALQFAHDEGIVHRDIKPENILIDKRGRVRIADFGLAKLLSRAPEDLSLTGTGQLMGTLGYMAPEQLHQAHAVDHRADIYSLGVVLYEMLTGRLPMGKFDPPSKKVQVDVRLDEVVLHALENEPDRRYQHASEVKTDVESIRSAPCPPAGSRAPFATAASLPPREGLGFDDEYFQHQAGRSESGAEKRNGSWTEQPTHPRLGKLALSICLGGTVVALFILGRDGPFDEHAQYMASLWMVASQVISLALGVVSRREALGRASAVASGILLLLSLVVFAITLVRPRDEPTIVFPEIGKPQQRAIPPKAIPPQVLDSAHLTRPLANWTFGPDGPELTDRELRYCLRPDQVGPVNKALQESFRDYLKIEKSNLDQTTDEQGHLITVIRPLSKELGSLEGRLWSRLDPILDRQQQNIFRLNLQLYPQQSVVGATLGDLVRPGLFGWGQQGARVEIWREGTWFRWNVSSENHADTSRAPELPEAFRRFWK
jgi:serine/threonine protein kinase